MNPSAVFVLPSGLRFVAIVDREEPYGFAVAAPYLLPADDRGDGEGGPALRPLLPFAELDTAWLDRAQVLCTYAPSAALAGHHFDEASRSSPAVLRRLEGQPAPAAEPVARVQLQPQPAAQAAPAPAPEAPARGFRTNAGATGAPPEPKAAPARPGTFPESALAHQLLDGLEGLEIGGAAHNPFGLKARNVDYTDDVTTIFKTEEVKLCGKYLPVDIVAPGDKLPLPDASVDFVVSSHVLEHFYDPIAAMKEWYRVIRPGGYIFAIVPHKERTFDADRPRTTLRELIERHDGTRPLEGADLHLHHSVWITEDLVEVVRHLGWDLVAVQDADDKVGNGFTVVVRRA